MTPRPHAREAAIVAVAEAPSHNGGRPALALLAEAAVAALHTCGLTLGDVDGLATTGLAGKFTATTVAEYLGVEPTWLDATNIGGASYQMFAARAARAIECGDADVVLLAYGSDQRTRKGRTLSSVEPEDVPVRRYELPYRPLLPISAYALAAQRHMHEFGTTSEQLAEVAVSAREWGRRNPAAFHYRGEPLTVDEVLASPVISSPLHKRDCCLVSDGGGAVVLTTLDRARDLVETPVKVLGGAVVSTHRQISAMPDLTRTGAHRSAELAFRRAALHPREVDVVEIYDSFTISVLLSVEALGLCERGESGAFAAGGRLGPGGARPINTNGGGLAHCHPGIYSIYLIIEAVLQLTKQAGTRQLAPAETAVCHGTGGYLGTHATLLLGSAA